MVHIRGAVSSRHGIVVSDGELMMEISVGICRNVEADSNFVEISYMFLEVYL